MQGIASCMNEFTDGARPYPDLITRAFLVLRILKVGIVKIVGDLLDLQESRIN
jgi:hypothetical protein